MTIPGTDIVLPQSEPIHLQGEADAYADESRDNAYARLFNAACQCGFMVQKDKPQSIIVWQESRVFRLCYGRDGSRLTAVWWRSAHDDKAPWRLGKRL